MMKTAERVLLGKIQFVVLTMIASMMLTMCTPSQQTSPSVSIPSAQSLPSTSKELGGLSTSTEASTIMNATFDAWMLHDTCHMPCWFGIEPGKTNLSETETILNQLPFIEHVEIGIVDSLGGYFSAYQFTSDLSSGKILVSGEAVGETPVISNIVFESDESVTMNQIVDRFGEPTYVMALAREEHSDLGYSLSFELVYLDEGISLLWGGLDGSIPDPFDETNEFSVYMFAPTLQGYNLANRASTFSDLLQPFAGHYEFLSYCIGVCELVSNES